MKKNETSISVTKDHIMISFPPPKELAWQAIEAIVYTFEPASLRQFIHELNQALLSQDVLRNKP